MGDAKRNLPRVLIGEAELERRIGELAAEIDRDYAGCERLICVGVLKGSVFFMVDLLKRVNVPLAVDFLQTSSYGAATSPGEVRIRKDIDLSIRGSDVLLIEDHGTIVTATLIQTDLPLESDIAVFDAVRLATALGVVVVEAAGNGGHDLDAFADPAGLPLFLASFRDSGAILVASAFPASRCPYASTSSGTTSSNG